MVRKSDFYYNLPPELIAQHPASRRDAARLMVLHSDGKLEHKVVSDLPDLIPQGTLLVLNNTRVIPARLFGKKPTGGKVELFLYRNTPDPLVWEALLKTHGRRRTGMRVLLEDSVEAEVVQIFERGRVLVRFSGIDKAKFHQWLERVGHVPLPPYIKRQDEPIDKERYQTVYAQSPGAVAAPTAGLHLTEELLARLNEKGCEITYLTLHVGLGTFEPLPDGELGEDFKLHPELVEVPPQTAEAVSRARAQGRTVLAVGTTVVRALETAAVAPGKVEPFFGETSLFIYPPYEFKVVDALLTNFHLPESSLLMLVCAFGGKERILAAYNEAVRQKYRFFSYGDAMLIFPRRED